MSAQTLCQIIVFVGAVLSLGGAFGSYYFGKQEDAERERENDKKVQTVTDKLVTLERMQENSSRQMAVIYNSHVEKDGVWTSIELKNAPSQSDYLMLLTSADKGRILGRLRIQGSSEVYSFSTTTNNTLPIAVKNLWVSHRNHYAAPIILEFKITEQTEKDSIFTISTQGWIDRRGQEPN